MTTFSEEADKTTEPSEVKASRNSYKTTPERSRLNMFDILSAKFKTT